MAVVLGVTDLTGYTGTNINGAAGAYARAMQFTASADATVTSVEWYFNSGYDGDARVKLFITNSSGTILGITGAVVASAAGGDAWVGDSVGSVSITSGQTYYLGWYCDDTYGPATGRLGVFASGSGGYVDTTSGSYATPPAALSLSADGGMAAYAIRASGSLGSPVLLFTTQHR